MLHLYMLNLYVNNKSRILIIKLRDIGNFGPDSIYQGLYYAIMFFLFRMNDLLSSFRFPPSFHNFRAKISSKSFCKRQKKSMTVSRVEVASRERCTLLFVRKNSPGNEETRIQWHDSAESTASSYARSRNKRKKEEKKKRKEFVGRELRVVRRSLFFEQERGCFFEKN